MEEREALKRQIDLLQNLINRHKSVHGDAPSSGAAPPYTGSRAFARSHTAAASQTVNFRATHYAPQSRGSWRRTYSLRNKNLQTSTPSPATAPSVSHVSSGNVGEVVSGTVSTGVVSGTGTAKQKTLANISTATAGEQKSSGRVVQAEVKTASSLQVEPSLTRSAFNKQTFPEKAASTPPRSALSIEASRKPPESQNSQSSAPYKTKFTWVKNQVAQGGPKYVTASTSNAPTSGSSTHSRRTPSKKLPRKLSPAAPPPKTSKYRWVSSSAGPRTSRKPVVPKPVTPKGDSGKKIKPGVASSAKPKRGPLSSPGYPLSSRYSWKAGGALKSPALAAGRRTAFSWTSERARAARASPTSIHRSVSSPGGFKLRSRMKIIRKSPSSGPDKSGRTSPAKISPRTLSLTRTPTGMRRTPSRELVAFGRHKLRRLSSTASKTSPASSSQRVFRTRYKMVTRPNTSVNYYNNPALTWRAKRIQTARSFLQRRKRTSPPSQNLLWKGSSVCWIRGSLYRVSANKLSRTVSPNMSINRTGRGSASPHAASAVPSRTSSTRHLASRAVQRSLAIIRLARQKKQPRQYCMYYNRFGKCNRGDSCPYIHDPDKVAVCTRFLRGTCKQADGTCPFSHKVAKEKMPVCSYFLKGICNNNECPYSHVYVSHKAKVCEDFVLGYCPAGEKCKKKHTLVCPDFSKTGSCPQGSRCKLQHRQRPKRTASQDHQTPKRPRLSVLVPPEPPQNPPAGSLALPSFISLCSSPEDADTPDTLLPETSQFKEKKLQIKPRL
ncbi:zinc finger CCCH domain-containing protein 3 [Neosynchiropus ocellatus]